jgi:hypothetical protein
MGNICATCKTTQSSRFIKNQDLGLLCLSCYKANERKLNAAKIKEYKRKHYLENKEQILQKNKTYRSENQEDQKEYHAKYRKENADKIAQYKADWYLKNKDEIKKDRAKYYEKHREEILAHKNSRSKVDSAKDILNEASEDQSVISLRGVFSHIKSEE